MIVLLQSTATGKDLGLRDVHLRGSGCVSDARHSPSGAGEQREPVVRMRAAIDAKRVENAVLPAELAALRESFTALRSELYVVPERERLPGLRVAELERRLGPEGANSGTPGSKEGIGRG
jgi:hypothetical protein